jgi:hypothetical protein
LYNIYGVHTTFQKKFFVFPAMQPNNM